MSGFGSIGAGIGDLFSAQGDEEEAGAFGQAAALAGQAATEAQESGNIQEAQTQRKIYQTIGSESAEVAGAGLQTSGSELDLLKSSQQQGALSEALIGTQTAINVTGYKEQQQAYLAEQDQAQAASEAATAGGIMGILGGILSFL